MPLDRDQADIDAALAAMDQAPLPEGPISAAADTPSVTEASPTLAALPEPRRPKTATVCERCPNSLWFASPAEVKCYCRVMFLVSWTNKEPNVLNLCDGLFLGLD